VFLPETLIIHSYDYFDILGDKETFTCMFYLKHFYTCFKNLIILCSGLSLNNETRFLEFLILKQLTEFRRQMFN